MGGPRLCRWAALMGLVVILASAASAITRAQSSNEIDALNAQVVKLYQAGKHAEAAEIAKRLLMLAEKQFGLDHPSVFNALDKLATINLALGRYAEAEPLYKRSLAILEKVHGADHAHVGTGLSNLAQVYQNQGRYGEAEPLIKRALAIREKALGLDHPDVGTSLDTLGVIYFSQGRYAEGELIFKRSLSIFEKALGPDHAYVGTSLNNLAQLYQSQGRYAEAEPALKRALIIYEKVLGPDHFFVGATVNNLALLYQNQGRYGEAEPLYRRAIAIREKAVGPDHPDVASTLNNLAVLYQAQKRFAEAEPLYVRSLGVRENAFGPDHPLVGNSLNNLAMFYQAQGRYAQAEPLHKRALANLEKALSPDHPEVGQSLSNLGWMYLDQSRFSDAEPLFKSSLAIIEKALGPDHPTVGALLSNLAQLYFAQRDWTTAAMYWRRSTGLLIRRSKRGTEIVGTALTGKGKSDAERARYEFWGLIKVTHRLAEADVERAPELAGEAFKTAQWAQSSEAAASVAQMAARQAKGDSALSRLVRERQDLVSEWQASDKVLITARSAPSDKRNASTEATISVRLAAIDARLTEIDGTLKNEFPDYATLASPEPLIISEVQSLLRDDEALVLFLDIPEWQVTPEETFIWVVTKTNARWVRSDFGPRAFAERAAALRCGLDAAAWQDGADRCAGLLKGNYKAADAAVGKPLPFDVKRAHEQYQALFGQVEDLIKDKHLLLVPSGPLTALPYQVLVTAEPASAIPADASGYANVAWLAKRQTTTVLPSVSSLKALRQFAKVASATQPFIGFGNPLLLGPDGNDRRAWERQSCKSSPGPVQIASRSVRAATHRFFRNGLANVEEVRAQYPLPETTDELCAVAQSVGAGQAAVYLGEKASETTIKAISANGTLASARVVHFATHGLLAGETEMLGASKAEPALILSPPEQATEEDDGLLTASEIAQLKLDADWILLSACNTAAGGSDKPGTEALSGLARAFFYAGARAMLVSHWAVNSDATVKLITKAFDEIKADPKIGRSEALRRSMLALVATGGMNAHPANWAPFVVVGEGAAVR
jgi:CHAT domain-containing protein/Tfp pilus assembly protein PilF